MKGANVKEKSSVLFISRGLIIIAILTASSLSFLLGFFVGKSTIKENPNTKPLQVANSPTDAKQQVPSQANAQPTEVVAQPVTAAPTVQTQEPKKIVYTIQVGAFENTSEAKALKAKLKKRGYKVYVTHPGSQGDVRLYKVRIGEFTTRQEAEVLSSKIKKTTGLQTFVTFKTE